jgi:hypothetical protein
MWASDARIEALGGNAGFWPDDDQNYTLFPQTINNLDMIQVTGAGEGTGTVGIIWGEGTTWGFMYDGVDDDNENDLINIAWGNGNMGALVSFGMSSHDTGVTGENATSTNEIGVNWGQNMGFGELGVGFAMESGDDGVAANKQYSAMGLSANLRREQSLWLFSNMLTSFNYVQIGNMNNMVEGGDDVDDVWTGMDLTIDCFTTIGASDNVNAVFAMGLGYMNMTYDSGVAGADHPNTFTAIALPNTSIGVEAVVTDWATVRFGMNHTYYLSQTAKETGSSAESKAMGETEFGWNFGLGFDYGSFQLDMVLNDEGIFNNPVHYVTGRNTNALASSATLTYTF